MTGGLALGLLWLSGIASAAPGLTVTPAWDGNFVPGRSSEIRLQVSSPAGGAFQLNLTTPGWVIRYSGVVEANIGTDLSLPIYPAPGQPVQIQLQRAGQPPLRQTLVFNHRAEPLQAWVVPPGSSPPSAARGQVPVSVGMLPRTSEGYGGIASLSIPSSQLSQLDSRQLDALDDYLSGCKPLHLIDTTQEVVDIIKSHAGCGGRHIEISGPVASVGQPKPLPGASILDRLLPATDQSYPRLAILYFVGYAVILLFGLLLSGRALVLLSIPVAASLALPALAYLGATPPRLVTWMETEAGDSSARYTALLSVDGARREQLSLPLDGIRNLPTSSASSSNVVSIDGTRDQTRQLLIETQPFSTAWYLFSGTVRLTQPLALTGSVHLPQITNSTNTFTPSCLLSWSGEIHQIPPLRPGEHWTPTEQSRSARHDPLTGLLGSRSGELALLIPYNLPVEAFGNASREGWLLIRADRS